MQPSTILESAILEPFGVAERAPAMLELRGHNGVSLALPYSRLEAMTLNPIEGLRLEFAEHSVQVSGRNLRPVYEALLNHQVRFIQEEYFDAQPETDTFVDAIVVKRDSQVP